MKKINLIWIILIFLVLINSLDIDALPSNCQVAYPQFGTVVCEGSTPAQYDIVKKTFETKGDISSVSFSCNSECFLDGLSSIRDKDSKGLSVGGQVCSGFFGGFEIEFFVGTRSMGKVYSNKGSVTFPIRFGREEGELTIIGQCKNLVSLVPFEVSPITADIRQNKIYLYEGNPDQPVTRRLDDTIGCIPNSFVQKYQKEQPVQNNVPEQFHTSSTTTNTKPSNYKKIDDFKKIFAPTNLEPGQTYSYLYGWRVVPDINVVYGKTGQPVGYCGGSTGSRKLFSYSQVNSGSGNCYLIPTSLQKNVQCCYNEDCRFIDAGGSMVCDPTTFTCTNERPCNSDFECSIPGQEGCVNKIENSFKCDFSRPWNPYKGTCKKTTKTVACCSNNDCSSEEYCDKEKGCKARYTLLECPSESCCLSGGNYQARQCEVGKQCCTVGSSTMGSCKETCNSQTTEIAGCKSDSDCTEGKKCNVELGRCIIKSECTPLRKSGDSKEKIDILFLGDGYSSNEQLEKDVTQILDNQYGLLNAVPFSQNKDSFNFLIYAVDNKINHYSAGYPNEDDTVREARKCGVYDHLVLLSNKEFRSYCYTPQFLRPGGQCYISLGNNIGKGMLQPTNVRVVLHELGHAFGLLDEYVETSQGNRPGYPNCAPNEAAAREWWKTYITNGQAGIYKGCSYVDYNVRPTENSIMNNHYDVSVTYGKVNEEHIKSQIQKTTGQRTIPALQKAETEIILIATLDYNIPNKKLDLTKIDLAEGTLQFIEEKEGLYNLIIKSEQNEELYNTKISPPTNFFDLKKPPEKIAFNTKIPYYKNAKTLEIYDSQGNKIISFDLKEFQPTPNKNSIAINNKIITYSIITIIVLLIIGLQIIILIKLRR